MSIIHAFDNYVSAIMLIFFTFSPACGIRKKGCEARTVAMVKILHSNLNLALSRTTRWEDICEINPQEKLNVERNRKKGRNSANLSG